MNFHRTTAVPSCPPINAEPRTMEEVLDERRAGALEKARVAVDRCESELRGAMSDAGTDVEAVAAIQSALDGLHDYGCEIHAEIASRERDDRILRMEAEAEERAEFENSLALASPSKTGRV